MQINLCVNCMEEMEGEVCPHCGFCPSQEIQMPNALEWNTILHGRYLIGRMLGQGGFGITYIGLDLPLNAKVAVKEYFPMEHVSRNCSYSNKLRWGTSMASQEQWKRGCENFLKEARQMAKIDAIPEIVRVRDTFTENNTAYIVMDYVKGATLKDAIEAKGPMKMEDCLNMLEPLAMALEQMHRKGMLHRDISPDNIMILPNQKVKLLDFGAAKDFTMDGSEKSQLVAKRGFSPVEQYYTDGNIGPWTDVYALTATIYYAVSGKRVPESLDRMAQDTLAIPLNPQYGLTKKVVEVLRRGLALKTGARIQSVGELFTRLRNASSPDKPLARILSSAALIGLASTGAFLLMCFLVGWLMVRNTTQTWTEGSITFVGNRENGKIEGRGEAIYADGSRYEGMFRQGKREGEGVLFYPEDDELDRVKYDGEWDNDTINGSGTMSWSDGDRYEGDWQNGYRHGTGTYFWQDGSRYEGEWQKGSEHGTGTYYYPEDDENGRLKYVGEWVDGDNADGYGMLYYKDGRTAVGTWKDNRLQE